MNDTGAYVPGDADFVLRAMNSYAPHLATIAAQREVIEAQNSALGRVLSMLKLSLANHPVICADEGIAEAERALELAKGGTGNDLEA